MSGPQLKPCPFCGDAMEPYGEHAQHPGDDCVLSQMIIFDDAYGEWNRRTPDPAQIRADALREAAAIAYRICAETRHVSLGQKAENAIIALLATPLSPTAVDGSPAPDAGGKEDK